MEVETSTSQSQITSQVKVESAQGKMDDDALVFVWQAHHCLYDHGCEHYHSRQKKREALQSIADELGNGVTADQVQTRINSLRTQYGKCIRMQPNENSPLLKELTTKQQWLQDSLSWMKPHIKARRSMSSVEILDMSDRSEMPDGDTDGETVDVLSESMGVDNGAPGDGKMDTLPMIGVAKRPFTGKRNARPLCKGTAPHLLRGVVPGVREDPLDMFGRYVASELRQIQDQRLLAIVKHGIHQVLFEATVNALPTQPQPMVAEAPPPQSSAPSTPVQTQIVAQTTLATSTPNTMLSLSAPAPAE